MRKLSFIPSLLLCCSMALCSFNSLASTGESDADVENIKAPPRDVKDILKFIEQSKQNAILEDKAKKLLRYLYQVHLTRKS